MNSPGNTDTADEATTRRKDPDRAKCDPKPDLNKMITFHLI